MNEENNIMAHTTNNIDKPFIPEKESINNSHYLCSKCLIFPFIEFCRDKKHIKFTCLCYNNKKISIKDLLDKDNKFIIIEGNKTNLEYVKYIICSKHNKKYEFFCESHFTHVCSDENKGKNCCVIKFDEIKFDNKKLEILKNKINFNNDINKEDISKMTHKKIIKNKEILNKEEEDQFNQLVKIIINDYLNFPYISHFFNMQNLFHFFNIKDESETNETNNITLNNEIKQKDEIIIDYINNNYETTKLFHKTFVKNNKDKVLLK